MKKIMVFCVAFSIIALVCFAADTLFTFDSDASGWNSPGTTWNTTIAHDAVEGHDAAGSIECTDSDVWCGARNTVPMAAGNPAYTVTAWVKLVSIDTGYGMSLQTYNLDLDTPAGTADKYSTVTLNVWQSQTHSGNAFSAAGLGYIMIASQAPWAASDPATYDWFIDDVSYTESSGVGDWSLYASKP